MTHRSPATAPGIRTLVILGAGGDLTRRLLLPGLAGCLAAGVPGHPVTVIGAGHGEDPGFAATVREAFAGALGAPDRQPEAVRTAADSARWITADATDSGDLAGLLDQAPGPAALYFALPPSVTEEACRALAGLDAEGRLPEDTVVVLEKPVGDGLDSARRLNRLLAGFLPEERVVRADHFLGMPGLLALLGMRLGSGLLEPLWNRDHVERIEITYDETLGLEGRADFYDRTGAARDMIQSHLLQTMAVVMMDRPAPDGGSRGTPAEAGLPTAGLPAAAARVLRATRLRSGPVDGSPDGPESPSVLRGRYTAGTVAGRRLPSYVQEVGVEASRQAETFAQASVEVDSERWAGVPVVVRSGKAIGTPRQEIAVVFRPPEDGRALADVLRVGFEDHRVELELNAGGPFDPRGTMRTVLRADLPEPALTAYGSVLRGILTGDRSFTVSATGAEEGWRITEEILAAYRSGDVPLRDYEAGSAGPAV